MGPGDGCPGGGGGLLDDVVRKYSIWSLLSSSDTSSVARYVKAKPKTVVSYRERGLGVDCMDEDELVWAKPVELKEQQGGGGGGDRTQEWWQSSVW